MNKSTFRLFLTMIVLVLVGRDVVSAESTETHCGDITGTETWSANDVHLVTCDVSILTDTTLIIEAGAIVKLQPDDSILVSGALNAQGTSDAPIIFTSYRDDTVGGDTNGDGASSGIVEDWGRIQFFETSDVANSTTTHAEFRFSGNDGSSSSDFGAITLSTTTPTLSNLKMSNNHVNGIEILGGSYPSSVWADAGVPYVLNGDYIIPSGATLTVHPNVVVKGEPDDSTALPVSNLPARWATAAGQPPI